tara:strand:- start:1858 stop:2682 length:825 start_codon:yes stop_codon:yes gene_type:complete
MKSITTEKIIKLKQDAQIIRQKIIKMAYKSGGGQHLGGGLSIVELMSYLYGHFLNCSPQRKLDSDRDRFILSKGHGVLGFYPTLHHYGFISDELIDSYKKEDSELISHPIMNLSNGIESSNGSLGHGLSFSIGIAKGLQIKCKQSKVCVLIGDGECNEGSIWEAAMSAVSLKLNNLICIIDNNKFQSDGATKDIIDCSSLLEKWSAFGWETKEIDGHDFLEIDKSFLSSTLRPKLIFAHTIKGKGIGFMENNNAWHHGRLNEKLYNAALEELNQ